MNKKVIKILLFIWLFLSTPLFARDLPKPELMLANVYQKEVNLDEYWVSEKLDGVRAYWNGSKFISRGGNIYHAPKWFTRGFPSSPLDGELWLARQSFERLVNTVRDKIPNELEWRDVKFMVFDIPNSKSPFNQRLAQLKKVVKSANIPWLRAVNQWKVADHQALMKELERYTRLGAEGLMLHRGSSLYKGKRNGDLLKVKSYQDAEATVIKHIPGKGKYKGMLGALVVKTQNNLTFKIGTGFSNLERKSPPSIGSTITYQYHGTTKNGIPRFASFQRIRITEK